MDNHICNACGDAVSEDYTHWAFEDPYCEHCFDQRFTYCEDCDCLIHQSEANYSADGLPYCDECYEKDYDDDAPNNPDVDEADRKMIIELSRNWLFGKVTNRGTLKVNKADLHLSKLRERVGVVDNPIYVFGLKDRDEYDLSVSPNLKDLVSEFLLLNGLSWTITEGIGSNRLGVSLTIREHQFKDLVRMIRSVTKTRVLQTA